MAHITNGVMELQGIHLYNVWYDNPQVGDNFFAMVHNHVGRSAQTVTVKGIGKIKDLMKQFGAVIYNSIGFNESVKLDGKRWTYNRDGMVVEFGGRYYICFNHKPYSHGPMADGTEMTHDPMDEFF